MRQILLIGILLVSLISCRKDESVPEFSAYDILLVMGQSNTHYGDDSTKASPSEHPDIFQLSRIQQQEPTIIPAVEPLHHHTRVDGKVGFAMTFAKLYVESELEPGRKLLIIPCGHINTSFKKNHWNKGNTLYEDAVNRFNKFMRNNPGSKLAATLWHQGESDISNPDYQKNLDKFINDFRTSINAPNSPFVLGGMVPFWAEKTSFRKKTQQIISDTPNRIDKTAYADPSSPFVIEKEDNTINSIHFDGKGLCELGKRYFSAYLEIKP